MLGTSQFTEIGARGGRAGERAQGAQGSRRYSDVPRNTEITAAGPPRSRAAQRVRPLLVFCGVALLALIIGMATGAHLLIGSFGEVETSAVTQKAAQLYNAFEADLRQLAISDRDYAEWDDAAEFVRSGSPQFVKGNFVRETLTGMHVDVVWVADRSGHEIYSSFLDRRAGEVITPAPRRYLQGLQRFLSEPQLMRLPPAERLVRTPHGLAAVAALEIRRTDGSGPTGAVMLFARFIEAAEVARIRDTSQLPVAVTYLDGSETSVPAAVRTWLAAEPTSHTFVLPDDEHRITGYALVRGIDRRPAALLATQSERDILALGYRTTWYMMGSIAATALVLGAALVWLLLRLQRSFDAEDAVRLRYQNIGAQLQESIVLLDARSFDVVEVNDAVIHALGCQRKDVRTLRVQDIFPDITEVMLRGAAAQPTGRTIHESRARRKLGPPLDTEVAISSMDIQGRRLLTLVGHDVSHRKQAEERERSNRRRLMKLAQQDSLTGLPNRLYLHTRLPLVLKKLESNERLLALVYVDLDHFKNINDARGHSSGDQLLQIIAKRLRAAVSAQDLVAHMGGDEFVVVASLMPDVAAVDDLAARLQTAISAPLVLETEPVSVTASMGIALYPRDGGDVESLLKFADIALYHAKEAGRHCHRFFSAAMNTKVSEHVAVEQALRHATGTQQIYMEYQPVIDLRTGRVASLEALMRWRHPERGTIAPGQFIPVAEKSGLIAELGEQALVQVLAQLAAWLAVDVPIVPIAVNVSPLQLDRTDFASLVERLAAEAGVDPQWLRFEITESAVMREPERLIGTLKRLRALGSQVLIDDFGTGYSSLSYLNRLPVDTLKIDRAFVADLAKDAARTPIIHAVIDLAKQLHLTTVAEGVETAEQAALLREHGCDYAQGYHYSRPVAAHHCRSLLEELRRERALTQTMLVRAISS